MNCQPSASVVMTMLGGGDSQTLVDGKKFEFYALAGGGDIKIFQFSIAAKS